MQKVMTDSESSDSSDDGCFELGEARRVVRGSSYRRTRSLWPPRVVFGISVAVIVVVIILGVFVGRAYFFSGATPPATSYLGGDTSHGDAVAVAPGSGASPIRSDKLPSLYCFSLMLPFGYEPVLTRAQVAKAAGIFGCDEYTVFSNETVELGRGITAGGIAGDLAVTYNDWTWKTVKMALNTEVFIRVWRAVYALGRFKHHDFTVKLDPDTVFFPMRLRQLIDARPVLPADDAPPAEGVCGTCQVSKDEKDPSCAGHIQWLQKHQGLSCPAALSQVSKPLDCDCHCTASACNRPQSVFFRNCATNEDGPGMAQHPALHGPIEVLSTQAVQDYGAGMDRCMSDLKSSFGQYGEDWFTDQCLVLLGVNPIHNFFSNLLSDSACMGFGKEPWPCKTPDVSFQPFKTVTSYMACMNNAETDGVWPPPPH